MFRSHVVAFLLLTVVMAAPMTASAQEVDGQHDIMWNVNATFSSTDPTGCIITTARIEASVVHGEEGWTLLDIDNFKVYNRCEGESLLDAYFSATDFTFDVGPRLEWATLSGTTTADYCWGSQCPATPFSLTIDLRWTATGPIERHHFQDHLNVGGEIDNEALNGVSRTAVASGTLTDGTANYTPNASEKAGIRSVVSASSWVTLH